MLDQVAPVKFLPVLAVVPVMGHGFLSVSLSTDRVISFPPAAILDAIPCKAEADPLRAASCSIVADVPAAAASNRARPVKTGGSFRCEATLPSLCCPDAAEWPVPSSSPGRPVISRCTAFFPAPVGVTGCRNSSGISARKREGSFSIPLPCKKRRFAQERKSRSWARVIPT